MVLLLETADVLEVRARRATDPAQVAVLLRRAEQRRRDAARLREELAAQGAALAAPSGHPSGRHVGALTQVIPAVSRRRAPAT
jgi:DNA-binding IclR family transcriptional regulator